MKYERKLKNALISKEICMSCNEIFDSEYIPGDFKNRDRICKDCKRKGSRGIQYDDFTKGHQSSCHISLNN
jgi:hypothetical protein